MCGWGCRGSPAHPSVTTSSGCDRQRLATVCCHARCQHSPPVCTAPTGALSVAWCVRGVLPAFPVGTKTSETRAIRIAMYINADVRKWLGSVRRRPKTSFDSDAHTPNRGSSARRPSLIGHWGQGNHGLAAHESQQKPVQKAQRAVRTCDMPVRKRPCPGF